MPDPLDPSARQVLAAYPPAIAEARWTPLGSAGGFSGARVWRGAADDGRVFCLKAHPPGVHPVRLERVIHSWMATAKGSGLDFVPAVERTKDGWIVVEAAGRVWDLTAWMPGRADFHQDPTDVRLLAAVTAVARLHDAWARAASIAPCPAVARRWQSVLEWDELVRGGWRPRFEPGDPVAPHAESAWNLLPPAVSRVGPSLRYWLNQPVPVQPCLCDVWHDHILFTGGQVTGVIDYAAAKVDHVAVDLARLLGSLVPDDPGRTEAGLRAYRTVRPLPQPELVVLLDRAGIVVGAINWLRWLYYEERLYPDRMAVAARLAGLVRRL